MPPALGISIAGGLQAGSIFQGQKAAQQQRRALRAQKDAQDKAEKRALSATRREDQERRRLNRRGPAEALSLLEKERAAARSGPASTLLTGPGQPANTKLGRTSLLGG